MAIMMPILSFTQGEEFGWNVGILVLYFEYLSVTLQQVHLVTGTQKNSLSVLKTDSRF